MQTKEFELFLDDISESFITDNFCQWYSRMIVPFSMMTPHGTVELDTLEQAEANFGYYVSACRTMKLTHIFRIPKALAVDDNGNWLGTYETNLLSHGTRMTAPYTSTAVLAAANGVWKMSAILDARGHADWTGCLPKEEMSRPQDLIKIANPLFLCS